MCGDNYNVLDYKIFPIKQLEYFSEESFRSITFWIILVTVAIQTCEVDKARDVI